MARRNFSFLLGSIEKVPFEFPLGCLPVAWVSQQRLRGPAYIVDFEL
jgi:hypothetical protein